MKSNIIGQPLIYGEIMRNLLAMILLVALSTSSWAVYDRSKLNDWLWHAHVCKNVAINLSIVAQMESKNGAFEVDKRSDELKSMIAKSVYENEKEVKFDLKDALLIADIVFAARSGIKESGGQINTNSAINQGFNICTHILKNFDKELRDKAK